MPDGHYSFPRAAAVRIAELVRRAPSGGIFTDAVVSEPTSINELHPFTSAAFTVATSQGELLVTVELIGWGSEAGA